VRSGLIKGVGGIGAALIVLMSSPAHAQNRRPAVELPVRIFDLTGQRDDQRQVALDTAATVMTTAGVRVIWTLCSAAVTSAPDCDRPLRDTERIVRVMQTSPPWSRQEGAPMGDSVVDGKSQSGVLATVYGDRVDWMASRAAINPAVLIGRAIAHELGHLLLGSRHASAGIMRRSWSANDLRCDRPGNWQFTREQVAMLGRLLLTFPAPSPPLPVAPPPSASHSRR
jgi:hypothetical protein